jgi:enoyl-CoA hydratase/carnithine racemase
MERHDDVFLLALGDAENRFDGDRLRAIADAIDEVAAAPAPRALVTTATGRYWSLGLDLDWMAANRERVNDHVALMHDVFARLLVADFPTVAAVQGHAVAGGAMLALAHDAIVMRADRGFFSFPEVEISIPFTPSLTALIAARMPARVAHEAMTTGRRWGGAEAAAAGIVDEAAAEDEVLPRALERANALAGKDPATVGTIKRRLYAGVVAALRDPAASSLAAA